MEVLACQNRGPVTEVVRSRRTRTNPSCMTRINRYIVHDSEMKVEATEDNASVIAISIREYLILYLCDDVQRT